MQAFGEWGDRVEGRKFAPPWMVAEFSEGFRIEDAAGNALAFVYAQNEHMAKRGIGLSRTDARALADTIAQVPRLAQSRTPTESVRVTHGPATSHPNDNALTFWRRPLAFTVTPKSGPVRAMNTLLDANHALTQDLPRQVFKKSHWMQAGKSLATAAETGTPEAILAATEHLVAALDREGWFRFKRELKAV
jgi:hypothetical protein